MKLSSIHLFSSLSLCLTLLYYCLSFSFSPYFQTYSWNRYIKIDPIEMVCTWSHYSYASALMKKRIWWRTHWPKGQASWHCWLSRLCLDRKTEKINKIEFLLSFESREEGNERKLKKFRGCLEVFFKKLFFCF